MTAFLVLLAVITGFILTISPFAGLFFLLVTLLIAVRRCTNKLPAALVLLTTIITFIFADQMTYSDAVESIPSFVVVDYKYYRDSLSYIVESDGNKFDLYSSQKLLIGDRCSGPFSIEVPGEERNFIKKNERLRLLMNGVDGRIYDDDIQHCEPVEKSFIMKISQMRSEYINKILSSTDGSFKFDVITLSIGNKSYIESKFFDALQKLGIYHLYVISGTHVAFITGVLFFIFKKMRLTIQTIKWLLITVLILFLLFNFFSPSVFRAVFMAVVLFITSMFRRKPYLTVISVSALIQIMMNPLVIFHAGFQLSYITTYFILLSRTFFADVSPVKQLFGITVIAELSTIMIVIVQFNEISMSGIVMNMIFVPLFSVIIFPAVILYNLAVLLNFTYFFNDLIEWIFTWFQQLIMFLGSAFKHRFLVRNMNDFLIVVLVIMTYIMSKMLLLGRYRQLIFTALVFFVLLFLNNKIQYNDFTVSMVDVGQGDAFIIEDHNNDMVVLIDTGGRFYMDDSNVKQSEKNILPYLKEQGIDKIDMMILTHMDIDHMGESKHIISKLNVERLVVNQMDIKFREWYSDLGNFKGDLIDSNSFRSLKAGNIEIQNLYFDYLSSSESSNDYSIVLKLKMNAYTFLMTGDMTGDMEENLINSGQDVTADVLKLAHHGSNSSSTEAFLSAVNYHTVLVSAGVNNRYHHPDTEVMERVGNAHIYSTVTDGMVRFKIRENIMCSEAKLTDEKKLCIKKDE